MAMKSSKPKSKSTKYMYEFGPFSLDSAEQLLLRDGAPLPLTPKAIETLMVLVQNSGHTVDKDELMQSVWPDTVVEENNLTQSVSALRKALGPEHPFIETVPRQGYRFVAMVKERREEVPQLIVRERTRQTVTIEEAPDLQTFEAATLSGEAADAVLIPQPARPAKVLAAGLALLAIILAAGVYGTSLFRSPRAPESSPGRPGIPPLTQGKYVTVLPFHALGEQASLRYLTAGLSGALTARLFQVKELHFVGALTGERTGREKPLETVGRELGVNLIVAGMTQESGDKIQVIVSIEDIAGKRKMWMQEFSAARNDMLALQDRVFEGLVAGLGLTPSPGELTRNIVHPTEDADAYDLYLKGWDALRNFKDVTDIETAISFFQAALNQDPNFALADAGLADASLEMYGQRKEKFWAEKALHSAQEALRLNPNLAEGHLAAGSVQFATGENGKAIEELKRALELDHNSDEGYRRLGSAYLANGQKHEAIQSYQKAIELSPYYVGNYLMLGNAYLDLAENAKALEAYRRVTELEPDNPEGYDNLGAAYLREGKWRDSISIFQKALKLQPHYETYSNLGTAYFFLKQYDDAVMMFEKAVEMNPDEQAAMGNLADAYRWSGHKDKAVPTYEKAIELGYKELQVNPKDPGVLGSLALYHAKKGDTVKALDLIHRARSYDQTTVELVYNEAVIQTLAGNTNEGMTLLREAFTKGYAPEEARNDPELASLRSDPDFEKLLEQFASKSN